MSSNSKDSRAISYSTTQIQPRVSLATAVHGASGRMGKTLIQAIAGDKTYRLVAALVRQTSPVIGIDAGVFAATKNLTVPLSADLTAINLANVVIDFSVPEAALTVAKQCHKAEKPIVIACTGFSPEQHEQILQISKAIPILATANSSIGITLCAHIASIVAQEMGNNVDVDILDSHHRNKTDAPSGTALFLAEAIASAQGHKLDDCRLDSHSGKRPDGRIGFSVLRAGDIIGEHTISFASSDERIEITHKASNRMLFARGALRAARWLAKQPPGLYSMQNIIGSQT